MQRIIAVTGVVLLLTVLLLAQENGGQAAQITATPPLTMPALPLAIREPSPQQLDAYFQDAIGATEYGYRTADADWFYADVSGDGEADLVIGGWVYVVVFVWEGDRYAEPFVILGSRGPRNPYGRVYVEDWTNDGIPDVAFDERNPASGSGYVYEEWERHVIVCTSGCRTVWEHIYAVLEVSNGYAMNMQRSMIVRTPVDGSPGIRVVSQAFSLYDYHRAILTGGSFIHVWGPWESGYT